MRRRICVENVIKILLLTLFYISSLLIWTSSLGAQTVIPASESLWLRHYNIDNLKSSPVRNKTTLKLESPFLHGGAGIIFLVFWKINSSMFLRCASWL